VLTSTIEDRIRRAPAPRRLPITVFTTLRLGHGWLDHGPSRSTRLFAGTVACASATPCSESYGAVVFSMDTVSWKADAPRGPEGRDGVCERPDLLLWRPWRTAVIDDKLSRGLKFVLRRRASRPLRGLDNTR
jgi:hypothetical protein